METLMLFRSRNRANVVTSLIEDLGSLSVQNIASGDVLHVRAYDADVFREIARKALETAEAIEKRQQSSAETRRLIPLASSGLTTRESQAMATELREAAL